jgi:hypothetical protein
MTSKLNIILKQTFNANCSFQFNDLIFSINFDHISSLVIQEYLDLFLLMSNLKNKMNLIKNMAF